MSVIAPDKPTLVSTNPIHAEYVIQFAPELSNYIRDGEKLKTYRYGTKYAYLKAGDNVELREYGSGSLISKAVITNIEHVKFKDIPLNLDKHEFYKSKAHQRKVFSSYYNYIGRAIADSDPFLVISYELVK